MIERTQLHHPLHASGEWFLSYHCTKTQSQILVQVLWLWLSSNDVDIMVMKRVHSQALLGLIARVWKSTRNYIVLSDVIYFNNKQYNMTILRLFYFMTLWTIKPVFRRTAFSVHLMKSFRYVQVFKKLSFKIFMSFTLLLKDTDISFSVGLLQKLTLF